MNISLRILLCFVVSCLTFTFASSANEKEAEKEAEKAAEPLPSKGTKELKDGNNYKTLDPLIIPIVKTGKVYGYLRLEIQLATKDGTSIEPFQTVFPILVDAYVSQLYSLIGDRWIPGQPLNQDTILQVIRDLTSKIVKEKTKSENVATYLKNFFFAPANT